MLAKHTFGAGSARPDVRDQDVFVAPILQDNCGGSRHTLIDNAEIEVVGKGGKP
jgi:hypothetical protein